MNFTKILLSATLGLLLSCSTVSAADALEFPKAEKRPVLDSWFGVELLDNYQWMEKSQDPAVKAYADMQNVRTRNYLDALPEYPFFRNYFRDTTPKTPFTDYEVEKTTLSTSNNGTITLEIRKPRNFIKNGSSPAIFFTRESEQAGSTLDFPPAELWLKRDGILIFAEVKTPPTSNDIALCLQSLFDKKYTNPKKLGLFDYDGFLGPLLTDYPALFQIYIAKDGIFDPVAGCLNPSTDRSKFNSALANSPYRRVVDHTPYPSVFLVANTSDGGYELSHSLKMVARLQEATVLPSMIVFAKGSETSPADYLAFLFHELNVPLPDPK